MADTSARLDQITNNDFIENVDKDDVDTWIWTKKHVAVMPKKCGHKIKFVTLCMRYIKANNLKEEWPYSQETINEHKRLVVEGLIKIKNSSDDTTDLHRRIVRNFEVMNELHGPNGYRTILLKKLKNGSKKVVDILSLFDHLFYVHSKEVHHGISENTLKAVNPNLFVPQVAADLFIATCSFCRCSSSDVVTSSKLTQPVTLKNQTVSENKNLSLSNNNSNLPVIARTNPPILLSKPSQSILKKRNTLFSDKELMETLEKPVLNASSQSCSSVTVTGAVGKEPDVIPKVNLPAKNNSVICEEPTKSASHAIQSPIAAHQSQSILKIQESKPNRFVEILTHESFTTSTDLSDEFQHIIIYFNQYTNHILLRPLTSYTAEAISLELFKIFTDFGVPKRIDTVKNDDVVDLLKRSISILKMHFNIGCKVKALDSVNCSVNSKSLIGIEVIDRLQEWITKTNCKKWAIGCYIIQHEMNMLKILPYVSPFKRTSSAKSFKGIENSLGVRKRKHENINKNDKVKTPSEMVSRDTAKADSKNLPMLPIDVSKVSSDVTVGSFDIQDEDSLEAFKEVNSVDNDSNSSPSNHIITPKLNPPDYAKSFESFANFKLAHSNIPESNVNYPKMKRTKRSSKSGEKSGTADMEDSVEFDADSVKEEHSLIANEDFSDDLKNDACHVCNRDMDKTSNTAIKKCLQCGKYAHQSCCSSTYQQNNQTVCLNCMFKDGVPMDD